MTKLQREIRQWTQAGFPVDVVSAPVDAVQFDQMLVVFSDESRRHVRRVSFYNSRTDTFLAAF